MSPGTEAETKKVIIGNLEKSLVDGNGRPSVHKGGKESVSQWPRMPKNLIQRMKGPCPCGDESFEEHRPWLISRHFPILPAPVKSERRPGDVKLPGQTTLRIPSRLHGNPRRPWEETTTSRNDAVGDPTFLRNLRPLPLPGRR